MTLHYVVFKRLSQAECGEGETVANLPTVLELRGKGARAVSPAHRTADRQPCCPSHKGNCPEKPYPAHGHPLVFLGDLTSPSSLQFDQPRNVLSPNLISPQVTKYTSNVYSK